MSLQVTIPSRPSRVSAPGAASRRAPSPLQCRASGFARGSHLRCQAQPSKLQVHGVPSSTVQQRSMEASEVPVERTGGY